MKLFYVPMLEAKICPQGDISDTDNNWPHQSRDKPGLPDSSPSAGFGHSRSSVDNEQFGAGA